MPAKHFSMSPLNADEVFMHARRAAGGKARLVGVGFDPIAFMDGSDTPFVVCSIAYGTPLSSLRIRGQKFAEMLRFGVAPDEPLKLYAGQADPADESHFTIDYETPRGRGTIDGWLMPDETVKLQLRE